MCSEKADVGTYLLRDDAFPSFLEIAEKSVELVGVLGERSPKELVVRRRSQTSQGRAGKAFLGAS